MRFVVQGRENQNISGKECVKFANAIEGAEWDEVSCC